MANDLYPAGRVMTGKFINKARRFQKSGQSLRILNLRPAYQLSGRGPHPNPDGESSNW